MTFEELLKGTSDIKGHIITSTVKHCNVEADGDIYQIIRR